MSLDKATGSLAGRFCSLSLYFYSYKVLTDNMDLVNSRFMKRDCKKLFR